MVFHFPAAAHNIAAGRIEDTVTGAAGNILGLQNVNVGAGHLSVANKEAGRRQGSKAAADQVCIFVIHALRLFRSCKGFIVAVTIINSLSVLFILSKLCVAVAIVGGSFFGVSRLIPLFFLCC